MSQGHSVKGRQGWVESPLTGTLILSGTVPPQYPLPCMDLTFEVLVQLLRKG